MKKPFSLVVDAELADLLEERARREDRSVASLIRLLIQRALAAEAAGS